VLTLIFEERESYCGLQWSANDLFIIEVDWNLQYMAAVLWHMKNNKLFFH